MNKNKSLKRELWKSSFGKKRKIFEQQLVVRVCKPQNTMSHNAPVQGVHE